MTTSLSKNADTGSIGNLRKPVGFPVNIFYKETSLAPFLKKAFPPGGILLIFLILAGLSGCPSAPPSPPPEGPVEGPGGELPPLTAADTESILTRIALLLNRRDYGEALALFDRIDPAEAETSGIRLIKASVLAAAGRLEEARGIAGEIVSLEPGNMEALLVLANIEGAAGREREQRTLLERVIKTEPANTGALISLGNIALRGRSLRTAASYFDRALAADPQNGDALVGRAGVYRYERDPKNAETLLNKAVTLYPQWPLPYGERARLYSEAGFPNDALKDLDKAKDLDPRDYWVAVDRGNVLLDLNRKEEALGEFTRAIVLDPDNFLAYVYSAGIKDDLADHDGAEKDYLALTRLNPDYYFAFEGVGIHKMRKQLWAEARDAFVEAYKRAPETSYALLAAANWMRAGRQTDPRQFLEDAIRKTQRESLEWYMLRLYHDLTGDADVAIRIDRETKYDVKAKMLYYLAQYYDIRGNRSLADKYFLQSSDLNQRGILEWRLNDWIVTERSLKVY
jgi:tetratricopeptide (TPR) repeat protein